jgi:hypothetical protein
LLTVVRTTAGSRKDTLVKREEAAKALEAEKAQERVTKELEGQKERTAKAEGDLSQLKTRTLTPKQRASIYTAVKPFSDQKMYITEYGLDSEAAPFSSEIQSELVLAGWNARVIGKLTGIEQDKGVFLSVEDGKQPPAATALLAVLNRFGFHASMAPRGRYFPDPLPADVIGMFVGPRP